jgi:ferredoxin
MPGNNITLYSAWPLCFQRYLNKKAKTKTTAVAEAIKAKRHTRIRKGFPLFRLTKTTFIERVADFEKFAKDFRVSDKCTGCGTCAKVCPMRNIVFENGCPQFGESCQRCTACIQWCPVKAIGYKDVTVNRKQYRHPEVKVYELFTKS